MTSGPRRFTGWWYLPVTILTFGLFTWVPVLHAAGHLRRAAVYGWGAAYLGVAAGSVALLDQGARPFGWIAFFILLTTIFVGCGHQLALRSERIRREPPREKRPRTPPGPGDPAVAQALAARERRREARELAAKDPLLAKDLLIGRPDLRRRYDDGGLVDLNAATAETLAAAFGLDPAQARSVVEARAAFGGAFTAVDDVFAVTELPLASWDVIRDRGIVYG